MQLLWRHHARVRSTQLTGSHTLDPLHIPGEIASTTTGEIKNIWRRAPAEFDWPSCTDLALATVRERSETDAFRLISGEQTDKELTWLR